MTVIFVAAITAMVHRTPSQLARDVPGNLGDPVLTIWILGWGGHALLHHPLSVFNANIFWPYHNTLALSDSLLSLSPVYAVFYGVTGNWVLSQNLLLLGLVGLNMGATYSLTRWLTGSTEGGVVAGLAGGFSAFVLSQFGHLQLQLVGFLAMGILLLFKVLERPRLLTAIAFGVVNVIIALGGLYLAAIYAVAIATILIAFLVLRRRRLPARLLSMLLVAGAVSLVALPGLLPYHTAEQAFGVRPLVPWMGLRLRDTVRAAGGSYLYPTLARNTGPGSYERHVFPGFVAIALALIGLVSVAARRPASKQGVLDDSAVARPDRQLFILLLALTGLVSVALAVGATTGNWPTPFRFFHRFVPGFGGIRVPARLAAVALLGVAVLAGVGWAALCKRLAGHWTWIATGVVSIAVLAELAAPMPWAFLPRDTNTLAVYRALSHKPAGAVVELPMANPYQAPQVWAYTEPERMVWATLDFHPRVNGYSGYTVPTYASDANTFATLPSAAGWSRLRQLHVRYLVLHVGKQNGFPMYSQLQIRNLLAALPAGSSAMHYGPAWLVTLGRQ